MGSLELTLDTLEHTLFEEGGGGGPMELNIVKNEMRDELGKKVRIEWKYFFELKFCLHGAERKCRFNNGAVSRGTYLPRPPPPPPPRMNVIVLTSDLSLQ